MTGFFSSNRWKKRKQPRLNPAILAEIQRGYEVGEISSRTYKRLLRVYYANKLSGYTVDGGFELEH